MQLRLKVTLEKEDNQRQALKNKNCSFVDVFKVTDINQLKGLVIADVCEQSGKQLKKKSFFVRKNLPIVYEENKNVCGFVFLNTYYAIGRQQLLPLVFFLSSRILARSCKILDDLERSCQDLANMLILARSWQDVVNILPRF